MKFRMMLSALLLAACVVCVPGCRKTCKSDKCGKSDKVVATTPDEVATAYFQALLNGDTDAAVKLSVGDKASFFASQLSVGFAQTKAKAEADPNGKAAKGLAAIKNAKFNAKVEGDKATAVMIMVVDINGRKIERENEAFSFILKKVGGEWKIDADASFEKMNK